ncbi:MAG TPA: chromosome segregation protein SMC, partial [Burkholderiaceae bacterium]|nr:chromosome segregation protein SMC [Burkholderiaceae bacterium]
IDAVRWVLGESKASELRGESMQDVIFNGSGQRKPAGRASVELVFSNEDARAGGQWNSFAEIAVKRVLTRDGTSSYYINNQPVRRRDVQDVFLGTGLGPRAYAIIGQGTISRIIESKPEELRLFLEEAAGVSKYKERRRETESRLKDTRENLTRVEDILRELNANLEKLEAQAEVATRYRQLVDEQTLKQHQLWWLKHRDAAKEEERVKRAVEEAHNALQAKVAELRQVEAELETIRQGHYAAGDALHAAQGELAEASLEVSRLEERIRYVVEGRQRVQQRIAELDAQNAQWDQRRAADEAELARLGEQIQHAEQEAAEQAARADAHAGTLPGFEDKVREASAAADAQREAVNAVQQRIQLLAADSRNLQEQVSALRARRERLSAESVGLTAPDPQRLAEMQHQVPLLEQRHRSAEARLHELQEEMPVLDERRRAQHDEVNRQSAKQADLAARMAALRALQEKIQTEGKLKPWLAKHGLESLPGLWTQVHIEPGWETALESALRERLSALQVGRIDTLRAFATDPPPARLAFYTLPQATTPDTHRTLPRLADLLRLGDAGLQALFSDWLEGVYTAASLDDALAQRGKLTHGEVIITREGHAVSAHAVSFHAPDSEHDGLLARAQEIESLERQLRAQALIAEEARTVLVRLEAAYTDAGQRLLTLRREAMETQAGAHQAQVELLRLTQHAETTTARRSQIDGELAEIDGQLASFSERQGGSQSAFEQLDQQLADEQQRHADLDEATMATERELVDARETLRSLERQAQEAQFEARTLAARRAELQRALETAAEQVANNRRAGEQLTLELGALDDSAAQAGRHTALALKLDREQLLAARRSEYDDLSAKLKAHDEQRMTIEHGLEPLRDRITKLQLEEQAAQLGGAQYMEQLQQAQVDLDALAQSIARGGVRLSGLQSEIDRLGREVAALGAVNLAALEELTSSRERKQFLDAQNADLQEAIRTLEDAIRKIDLETRELLQQTFEQVNEHFGRMFPTLFGGGNARLVMTGDEILDAGVQVMAQPPGKRNSTIHLLSGGEKALTAIALVFAIFQLNPAPFCLLDEVDAPLDDANTERYCALVTEMSRQTQFLYISHNKIAMEMAEQLIGVTMQEQGVSRIVAVDMDEAVSLAQAA